MIGFLRIRAVRNMGARARRRAALTIHSRRVTPFEVAQLWFRRGADFAVEIHKEFPDFPRQGPDGLFLLSQIEAWFDQFHGKKLADVVSPDYEEEAAMRAASGK